MNPDDPITSTVGPVVQPPTPDKRFSGSVAPQPTRRAPLKSGPPPKLEPSPEFFYFHRYNDWSVVGGRIVPMLRKFKVKAGINGVTQRYQGEGAERVTVIYYQDALLDLQKTGATIIPRDVDGPDTDYCYQPVGCPHAWLSRWEHAFPGEAETEVDREGFTEWCATLVDRGVVRAPPVRLLDRLLQKVEQQLAAHMDHEKGTWRPFSENARAAISRQIETLKAAIAKAEG